MLCGVWRVYAWPNLRAEKGATSCCTILPFIHVSYDTTNHVSALCHTHFPSRYNSIARSHAFFHSSDNRSTELCAWCSEVPSAGPLNCPMLFSNYVVSLWAIATSKPSPGRQGGFDCCITPFALTQAAKRVDVSSMSLFHSFAFCTYADKKLSAWRFSAHLYFGEDAHPVLLIFTLFFKPFPDIALPVVR